MSDNIPESSASASSSTKKLKRKHDRVKLPTPPPDPQVPPQSKDFFEYLESLHKSITATYAKSTPTFAPVIATDEALDHLDKLYKLMEQMLELRESNAKLHRRIRDLEHLNNIEKMHKQLEIAGVERDFPELEKDTAFAEIILESIIAETKVKPTKAVPRLRPSILRKQRNRSTSIVPDRIFFEDQLHREISFEGTLDKPAKVSKWTKVKAAFKWEKASNSVSDSKSQDSGIGGMVPVNMEIARYLRVPSTSEELAHSPADSGAAEISTPGTLSTASSNEDFHRSEQNISDARTPYEDFRSSEDEQHYNSHSKDEQRFNKNLKYHHRTPWAKMKDIIQTRSSFKKKQRLSAQSDDIQIDVELCSDNEDVFEEECKTKANLSSSSPSPNPSCSYVRMNSNEISSDIVARYQQALWDDNKEHQKISKWTRVKKAFLPTEEVEENLSTNKPNETTTMEEEIQKAYQQLQIKLSSEFQEKLNDWERLKQSSPSTSNSPTCTHLEDNHDPHFMKKLEEWENIKTQRTPIACKNRANIQMTSQFDLPPEFKKKLQEWEKIKKSSTKENKKKIGDIPRWKSLSGHRPAISQNIEIPVISDEFRKKLDEWKQIKASGQNLVSKRLKEKTPSPKLTRKNSSPKHGKKHKEQGKEIHWFEKELNKIEKEKQRLERERKDFLEREERLSKLRRSVLGDLKKEVLVHTPSGFYKFEGISRKFTRKLYEWEKAQGIKPEASTFALLTSSYTDATVGANKKMKLSLVRSKSVDSIAMSTSNVNSAIISQQPSSLSLNDVDDLEKECMDDSKSSSMHYMLHSHEASDIDEPEALIVEVEDYEEETAGPLQTFVRREQLPIYQREEVKTLCEGETVAAPKVQRSESARAQTNYNLIEDIFNVLRNLSENEFEILNMCSLMTENEHKNVKLNIFNDKQKQLASKVLIKLAQLQEANNVVASNITQGENVDKNNVLELLDAVQDVSNEILNLTEKLNNQLENRISYKNVKLPNKEIIESLNSIRSKMMELRRNLSYVCAASDVTSPSKKKLFLIKKSVTKSVSNESKESRCDTSDNSRGSSIKKEKPDSRYIKADSKMNRSQGAIKKKIKYRQKSLQSTYSAADSDEDEEAVTENRKNKHKKLTRTRSISESNIKSVESKPLEPLVINKVIVSTESNFVTSPPPIEAQESPVTLFIKTTRKLFTPIGETQFGPISEDLKFTKPSIDVEAIHLKNTETITHLPPLPASPVPQRKLLKDVSPSIKIMMQKYNQKLSEQDLANCKSGGSSGSASPIAWRSPTAERRVKAQTERYQEVLSKLSPLLGGRREVQKSASVGYIQSGNKQVTVPIRAELLPKSTSSSNVPPFLNQSEPTTLPPCKKHVATKLCSSLDLRSKKLQKAKEEFFNSTPTPPAADKVDGLTFPTRNRLSQISVDSSESSFDIGSCSGALIKSASAGMINIDPDTYKQFDPELHGGGYVSLPRNSKTPKDGFLSSKFAFSNIASKFRKVKMRRGKEKMNAVSMLCRQSLIVDINPGEIKNEISSSDEHSSSSWIKKQSKLFKK